ncbi:THO complex subunit 5 like protein [Pteropus alecto]|uniref:THO complex subunit 5 like protein n=1 Tax=Pteropus alecto TaxID=9402 RepID=L5KAH8_PTEAL|nr:THO complex subunit 5 like protein [Pteropus alecto]
MGDPHQQTLAHLDSELEQQKGQEEKYLERLSNKEKILKETKAKKKYLSSLQPHLDSIIQASLSATTYGYTCDKTLSVTIKGSVAEAEALFKSPEDFQDGKSDTDVEEKQTTEHW